MQLENQREREKLKKWTFVEAWVVKTVVQPSPTVNPHEIESPYTRYYININD